MAQMMENELNGYLVNWELYRQPWEGALWKYASQLHHYAPSENLDTSLQP